MKIRIKEIAEMRGFKTAYELSERSGLSYPTADRAFRNDIKQFTPDTLERLCKTLFCTPNDIFGVDAAVEYPSLSGELSVDEISPEQYRRLSKVAQEQHKNNRILYERKVKQEEQKNGEPENAPVSENRNGVYFVNNTGKTILQLLDEAKENNRLSGKPANAFSNPLMTRVWDIGYDEENKKWMRKRLVNLKGAGWLTDEDLAALDPDEQVRDFDKNENVRLGDLRVYKAAKRKAAGLPTNSETKAARAKKREAKLDTIKDSLHGFLGERS